MNVTMALQKETHISDPDTEQTEPRQYIFRGALGWAHAQHLDPLGGMGVRHGPSHEGVGLEPAHWLPGNLKRAGGVIQPLLSAGPHTTDSPVLPLGQTLKSPLRVARPHPHQLCPVRSIHAPGLCTAVRRFFSHCTLEQSFTSPRQMFLSPFIFLFQRNCNRLCFN